MKKLKLAVLFIASFLTANVFADTPTEVLQKTVDQLIAVVVDKQKSDEAQHGEIETIIKANVDFDAVSQKVLAKSWADASDEQKQQFTEKFSTILIDTYFKLLKNYSNEQVDYGKEQIKRDKFAIVDTQVISENKKIPVRYRMINNGQGWKIYDFIVEGSSLTESYKNNYQIILRKDGMDALLTEMNKPKAAVN